MDVLQTLALMTIALGAGLVVGSGLTAALDAWFEAGVLADRATWPAVEDRPTRPERYPGCVTCEGAEAIGRQSLLAHQLRDHGAARW
jgi:hypothetical protein